MGKGGEIASGIDADGKVVAVIRATATISAFPEMSRSKLAWSV